jgi:hypothetical protein
MRSTGTSSSSKRDLRNQRLVLLCAFAWGCFFVAVTHGIRWGWLPSGVALAGVGTTALLGVATVLTYRRFLQETDELRRKIEVEALAFAFGAGLVGCLSYWQLVEIGAVPGRGYSYVFAAMILAHPLGVLIGRRRYS